MGTTGGDSGDGPVYKFFRNLRSFFGIPHRLEPGDPNRREKALKFHSPDLYDDTNYAGPNSFVQEFEEKGKNNDNSSTDENVPPVPGGENRRRGFPFGGKGFYEDRQFDPFGFGSVFGEMDALFQQMEKEFADMGKHFGGFGFPDSGEGEDDRRYGGFSLFNDPIIDRSDVEPGDGEQQGEGRSLMPYGRPNLRDEVLKPGQDDEGDGPGGSGGILDVPSDSSVLEVQPSPSFSWSSRSSSTFDGAFSSDGTSSKSQAYSQTIRDTPKGREITTFLQKPDGTTEKKTEFIPREDLDKQGVGSGGLTGPIEPFGFGFMRDFFRPRI